MIGRTVISLPTTEVIGLLSDNLRRRPGLNPLTRRASQGWAESLGLPRGGRQVLYTGQLPQLIPYLETLSLARDWIEDSPLSRFSRAGMTANRFVTVPRALGTPPRAQRNRYERILTDVVVLLRHLGLDPGYLYDDDLCTGALLPEESDELLADVGRQIRNRLTAHGVEEVITIDPHTTAMLRTVLPPLAPGLDISVRHYLEILAEISPLPLHDLAETVVLHDSCCFPRSEPLPDIPRALLRAGGLAVPEIHSGTIAPGQPSAETWVTELHTVASSGVTLCPVCLVNMQRAAQGTMPFHDISFFLRRAYTP